MWKTVLFAACLATGFIVMAEELVAHWDFSSGNLNSIVGDFKGNLRGNTRISSTEKNGKFLSIGIAPKEKPEGFIMKGIYPQLSPSGGFRLEVKFRLREQTGVVPNLMLWDSKYLLTGNHNGMHHGFSVYLLRRGEDRFLPIAWIGHGEHSGMYRGVEQTLVEGKLHVLTFEYDGIKKFVFRIDGKINHTGDAKKGGAMSPAIRPAVIGDRFGSDYHHFDGDIFELKLYTLP